MPTPRIIGRFGWIPDLPDHRDLIFSAPHPTLQSLPPSVDLRAQFPPVYDQGPIGSCTANAIAGAIQFDRLKDGQYPDFVPSRLFIYYNERQIEGSIPNDSGAYLRDGLKSIASSGVCMEADWPYDDTPAEYDGGPFPPGARAATEPSQACYNEALTYRAIQYFSVIQSLAQMKACLAAGYPFVFGFTVYSSYFDENNQLRVVTPMPSNDDAAIGGHAVVAVGYDDSTNLFTIRNSWGEGQGEGGYYYMPYAYLTDPGYCQDFWTIRRIED